MKVVVLGGVAAGTKAAAKLKREDPSAEVVIYTKGKDISYAGCGLPYYVGGVIEDREELIVNTPEKYMSLTGTQVYTGCEAVAVDAAAHQVTFADGQQVGYDKPIVAVGAAPIVPPVAGVELDGVFTMRTPDDAIAIRAYVEKHNCRRAVVVGGGFIGLEAAENLMAKGMGVTVVDMAPQLMPNIFDADMAGYVRRQLQNKGMRVLTGTALAGIRGEERVTGVVTASGVLSADVVVLSIGVRPATAFLQDSGLVMERGCIVTDEKQRTNLPDVYAVGDCAMVKNRMTGRLQWSAMGSTANIAGRCLALNLGGTEAAYLGCLGTGVVKLGEDLNAARTGLTEVQAREAGYDVETVTCVTDDKAHYYPDASTFTTKLIADKVSHKLLGLQGVGGGAVDKMADVAAMGITFNAKVEDFLTVDFAYAPPFSTAIHPMAAACGVMVNKLAGKLVSFTPAEYANGAAEGYTVVDVHPAPTLAGFPWADVAKPEEVAAKYGKEEKILFVCAKGKRGYLMQNKLRALGYTNIRVLEGGAAVNVIRRSAPAGGKLDPAEIKRVKGLGCLQDKRFGDVFNVRVITRNGKITTDEHRAVAEAAERFGSGAVAMTTRLTLEIQGVPYANIDPMIAFLAEHGLETGGTGSLVRPVVSCKGTTCQYGLADTYRLSEIIHQRFYEGYHKVTLPHKFKIAVGGCPNNCVKPDLNDLGIVGQRVPTFDFSKCRGCKVCMGLGCPSISFVDGKAKIDHTLCVGCGICSQLCKFDAIN